MLDLWNHVRTGTTYNELELPGTRWNHLKGTEINWNHLEQGGPLVTIWTQQQTDPKTNSFEETVRAILFPNRIQR